MYILIKRLPIDALNLDFQPFDDIKQLLIEGWPLSRSYHRLLIEDFMLLESDAPVVVFMNKKHPLMKSSTWKKQLKEVMTANPYEPLKLQSTYYFGFQMNVLRNIYRGGISNGARSTVRDSVFVGAIGSCH